MAATMHAKINRRKLDKLNIIKICEEILNPSVPMALRLSGILMGGVVIVYERKVKILYDDVTRLLVEINEAWKVKAAPDPTVLPKGKSQAKKEAVTLPENEEIDVGDIEQSLNFSNTRGFQQTAYFAMRLDTMDEPYTNDNAREEDPCQNFHQADADNITLFERFDSYQANADMFNRFERFDIEGDDETQLNFASGEHTEIPTTLLPSPHRHDNPLRADEFQYQHPDHQVNRTSDECKEAIQDQERQGVKRRKTRRPTASLMDYEQTVIPGPIYQSWLQNASDIVSRRGRKRKHTEIMSTMKIANLMELPPVVLIGGLFINGSKAVHYPPPLLELWMKSIQPPHGSASERTSPPLPPEPTSFSPPERAHYQESIGFPFEEFHSGAGSQSLGVSIEKQRTNVFNHEIPTEFLMDELRANLMNNRVRVAEANPMVTPGNSVDEAGSIPSSASGHGVLSHNSEVNSGRKRPYSSSRHSSGGLEPVAEENPWKHSDPNFKLTRLSENGPTPDQDLFVETGVTQTQHESINPPVEKMTDSIRMQMKAHFDTPGAPQVESLNNLAIGMSRKGAALLFYQTCVLASRDILRVEQTVPFGDILISRGAKM
ncbi:sister chromatid cohesion 1 protein 1 isoform X2 [Juglans microcarpa x Juglans regia]|uniref:sister chromatid cohesion 1 protein 1 isoform X2 n=1 Tax=Juglans microcarpa x Juglans regia TaxID=2249226 RepID=UPI001B7E6759|nr:sister chromatid cohesion 1 protein 1 isoform X2 [Juglans microcarpa x Juglans regia]